MKKKFLAVLFATAMCFLLAGCGKKTTINLNDYIKVTENGYDGYGTAYVSFDMNKFEDEYEDLIDWKIKDKSEIRKYEKKFDTDEPYEILINMCVEINCDVPSNLKNGDKLDIKWKVKEEKALENFKVVFEAEDGSYTVSNLDPVKTFNPFDYLNVSFSGTSPYGYVEYTYDYPEGVEYGYYFEYETPDGYYVKNGDKVTFTFCPYYDDETYVLNFGMKPELESVTKDYEVSELDEYVRSAKDIDSETFEAMKEKGVEVCKKLADGLSAYDYEQTVTYVGNYFDCKKEGCSAWVCENMIYFCYQVDTKFMLENRSGNIEEYTDTAYYYVRFNNFTNKDGVTTVDLDSYNTPYGYRYIDTGVSKAAWSNYTFYMDGYADIVSVYKDAIENNTEYFDYEINMNI